MGIQLVAATISITLALVLYTVGVFSEWTSGTLGLRHVLLFWGGLTFDTTGTAIMSGIAGQSDASAGIGVHGVTGMLAIALMLVHALWATVVYLRRNERSQRTFHTFSTLVWLVWLVPYVIGMLVGIPAIHLRTVCAVGTSVAIVGLVAAALSVAERRARRMAHGGREA